MNGQMNNSRYKASLEKMPQPVMPSQIPKIPMDLRGLSRYAKSKGTTFANLTEEEIRNFLPTYKK